MHYSTATYVLSALSYISIAKAMDMPDSSSSSSSESMMIPYLHFTGGDYLFFVGVAPTSSGAIAGACIALVVLAILERVVAAARGIFTLKVLDRKRALLRQMQAAPLASSTNKTPGVEKTLSSDGISTVATTPRSSPTFNVRPLPSKRQRSMAPFQWSHELIRGGLYIIQAFFLYAIMLAVMTFNAAYIISIIAGSAIGEVFFGRFIVEAAH